MSVHCKAQPTDPLDPHNRLDYNEDCASGDDGWYWIDDFTFGLCTDTCGRLKDEAYAEVAAMFKCDIPLCPSACPGTESAYRFIARKKTQSLGSCCFPPVPGGLGG